MALPKAPDIPMPRPNDKEYMELWHKYLQARQDKYVLEHERNAWRLAFWGIYAILMAIVFVLLVFVCSKIMNLNF